MTYEWRDAPRADFAVIGDPVKHSLSPKMHQAAYEALGLPYRYVAIRVNVGEVGEAFHHLKSLGYRGVNVTVPHKEEALLQSQNVDPLAQQVRAANTFRLSDMACINTDAPGFLDTLSAFHPVKKSVLVLGAGGSARALIVALLGAGWEIQLYNRTQSKADAIAESLQHPDLKVISNPDPRGACLILNTTSASLVGAELPIDWDRAESGAWAYDLMYAKEPTPFLAKAAERGLATVDGLPLLVAQGARAFEWWLGLEAPRQAMMEALR